jgi:hypothetical protein
VLCTTSDGDWQSIASLLSQSNWNLLRMFIKPFLRVRKNK